MIFGLYAVKDSKTGFGAVMMQPDDDSCIRLFEHECYQLSSLWNSHHEDFMLFKVGYFDTDNGYISRCENGNELLITATEVIKNKGDN